jgi:hypothetical protein
MAVNVWLYLKDRSFVYDVHGISVGVDRSGGMDATWTILFTREEFDTLFEQYKEYRTWKSV